MAAKLSKDLLRYPLHKLRYPRSAVAFGSIITGRSGVGKNVRVDKNAYIVDSVLGDNVHIQDDSSLFEVNCEGNNIIYPGCTLARTVLGSYSYIGEGAHAAGLKVGRFTSIAPYFLVGLGTHPTNFISTSPVFYSTRKQCGVTFVAENCFVEQTETHIGHDVWIGARVCLRDGIRIGHGAIVGAGAVVTKDVPDYAVVGGVPANTIRYRFGPEVITELLQIQWWNWPQDKLKQAQPHIAQAEIESFLEWARQA